VAAYVLIVESDPALQKRIGDALREARYELASEAEGSWARRSVAVRAPDAVVVDTRLSDGDGFSLAEELRRDPDTRGVPIFFVASAHRGASHRTEARRRFAPAEYLPTPLDVNSLLAMVLQAVPPGPDGPQAPPPAPDRRRADDDGEAEVAAAPESPPPPPPPAPDPAQQRERRDVERSAKTMAASDVELQGTLRRTPFARLLQRLYTDKASGSLLLLRESTKKIVAFDGGYPVSVRSNVLGECLGQILVSQKLITAEALAESLRRMQKEHRQQGQILVEMGALSPYNLQRALVEQVEAKLFEVFAWPDGKFMFKTGGQAPREALRLDRAPAALILEGIRRHYAGDRQRAVLESYVGQYVSSSPDPMLRLQEMTSDATELAFIHSIEGNERFEEVLDRAPIARDKARLLLVALSEAGMIAPSRSPTARRRGSGAAPLPSPPLRAGGGTAAGGAGAIPFPAAPAPSEPLSSGPLSMVLQTVRTQDYFWALGVERGATSEEIDRAYDALAPSFHPDRYRTSPDEDRRMAQEIFERLGEAHRALLDPGRRRAYVAKLEKGEGAEPGVEAARASETPGPTTASNAAARSLFEVGHEHLRARRHHDAVEAFRQAARIVPQEAEYRAALGWALFREAPADARAGRAALAELRRALQLDARNRHAIEYLAQFYAQTGRPELAIQELERLIAIDPTAVEAIEEMRRLRDSH
jgi:CheY-like chemotaxis protein/tetratricopeptide (TPR) repeat protein